MTGLDMVPLQHTVKSMSSPNSEVRKSTPTPFLSGMGGGGGGGGGGEGLKCFHTELWQSLQIWKFDSARYRGRLHGHLNRALQPVRKYIIY